MYFTVKITTKEYSCFFYKGDPEACEGSVQDGLGDQPEDGAAAGRRPGRFHRPVPVAQRTHCRAQLWQDELDALFRLAAGPEDGHVLPENQARCSGHPVHRGQGQGQGHPHLQVRSGGCS